MEQHASKRAPVGRSVRKPLNTRRFECPRKGIRPITPAGRESHHCNCAMRARARTLSSLQPSSSTSGASRSLLDKVVAPLLAGWLAAAVALVPVAATQAAEEGLTIRFKASKDPAIRQVQEALVETWGYVGTQFLDVHTNGVDWPRELQANLDKSFEAKRPEEVYDVIDKMLAKLDDPFTRVLRPNTAGAFENATEGQVVGMGFQVSEDQQGALRIAFVADNSPAQRAGIQTGDTLILINGQTAKDLEKQELAALLRTEADVLLQRNQDASNERQQLRLHLTAKPIEVHPVQYAALPGEGGRKVGYVRLLVFSKNAPKDVAAALKDLQGQAVDSVVLDLRDNVGGVVLSGYEVAQLFLPEGAQFCFVQDGRGASEDVKLADSHQLTTQPMIVLVNGGTASTAELIAASLHDNHRASLVGEKTFGKGRTQRIIPLKGGGLLLLSNTLYLTPEQKPVDKVGLTPEIACKPQYTETSYWVSGESGGSQALLEDPCIKLAIEKLDGK